MLRHRYARRSAGRRPIRRPITVIYNKSDAVVSWQGVMDHHSRNVRHVEMNAVHLGMGFNPSIRQQVVAALETDAG